MSEALQPEDHLSRLLKAQDAEIPWYKSLYQNIHDVIKPEKLPPLVLTSQPVAVKEIWGLYGADPKTRFYSVAIHAAVIALLLFLGTNATVQKIVKQKFDLVDP